MAERSPITRLQRGARRVRRFAYLAAALAVACVVGQLLAALAPLWRGGDPETALRHGLEQADLAVPVAIFVWGLWRARRLFQAVESGEVFGPGQSRDFGRIGWALVGGAAWSLTLGGLVPPPADVLGQQLAAVGLAARDLALLALGLALVVIGQMAAEARRLKLESDGFL